MGKKNGLRFQSGIRQVEKSRAVLEEEEARDFYQGLALRGTPPPGTEIDITFVRLFSSRKLGVGADHLTPNYTKLTPNRYFFLDGYDSYSMS